MFIHPPLISAPVNSAMRCWYLSSCFQFFGYICVCIYPGVELLNDMVMSGLGRSTGEGIFYPLQYSWASLVAQLVKNPPAMLETRV